MEVYLTDKAVDYQRGTELFAEADKWAAKTCISYKGYSVEDVSDFSYEYDRIAAYYFETEKDVMFFKLKWL